MKTHSKIWLLLATIIDNVQKKYGLSEVTQQLDEVIYFIKHFFLKITQEKRKRVNAQINSGKKGLGRLPLRLTRKSLINSKEKQKNERSLQKIIKSFALWILLLIPTSLVSAEDKGVLGEVFPIIEDDLLEVIQNKLGGLEKDGTLKSHQQQIQQQIEKGIKRPVPVKNLTTAQTASQTLFDPSIIVPHDLKDHQGRVFQKAGTKVNPLTMRSLSKPLLFIDGDDQAQIEWALSEHKANQLVKIILTSGAPLELSEKYNLPFYFDQDGVLTTKLGIKEVPSRVSQQDLYLSVESIPVNATHLGKEVK